MSQFRGNDAAAAALQKRIRGFTSRKRLLKEQAAAGDESAGYIQACVRVRPLGEGRGERGDIMTIDKANGEIVFGAQSTTEAKRGGNGLYRSPSSGARKGGGDKFEFERVFENEDNAALLEIIGKPLVNQVSGLATSLLHE